MSISNTKFDYSGMIRHMDLPLPYGDVRVSFPHDIKPEHVIDVTDWVRSVMLKYFHPEWQSISGAEDKDRGPEETVNEVIKVRELTDEQVLRSCARDLHSALMNANYRALTSSEYDCLDKLEIMMGHWHTRDEHERKRAATQADPKPDNLDIVTLNPSV